jgi:exonuclease VII large subunit
MYDPEQLLESAIEQIHTATAQLKQKHSMETKMWQKKAQELQTVMESLQSELRAVQQANHQMKASLDEANAELERLRGINASLTRVVQEKDQTVARYQSLNRSLRGLLDEPPEESVRTPLSKFTPSPFVAEAHPPPSAFKRPPVSAERFKPRSPPADAPPSPSRGASQGSMFIKAAKEELTYSDFNQMIAEINLYNTHQQSREDTIANVKRLLCPTHRGLFEQFLPMIGGD